MFTKEQVLGEMKTGLIFVCAMCKKYWEGKEKGLKRWDNTVRCTSQNGCGSPSSGGAFNDYDGPILNFKNLCYVCGEQSNYALRGVISESSISSKVIGVCEKHLDLVKRLKINEASKKTVNGQSDRIDTVKNPVIIGK
jgi:hypothetical protein